jgi:hypothetical protein
MKNVCDRETIIQQYQLSAGTIYYTENDSLHRKDGPAIVWENGSQEWFINGVRHRTNGPAYTYTDRYQGWCIKGRRYYTNKEFQEAADLSDEDMIAMILKYGDVE